MKETFRTITQCRLRRNGKPFEILTCIERKTPNTIEYGVVLATPKSAKFLDRDESKVVALACYLLFRAQSESRGELMV